ncbi:NEW3 domain-containing protein [Candidatus Zixiibacteriota bacterium]
MALWRYLVTVVIAAATLVMFIPSAGAQMNAPFNQRDDQYRLLGLKRAKEVYEVARADFNRQQELFNKGYITVVELEQARRTYADAEVNYQQSLLAVLFEEQFVSIAEAVKYQAPDGSKHVRLTIINSSGGTAEFRKLINLDDELFRSLQPDIINNVYVAILNEENAIISRPYESKIDQLRFDTPEQLDFMLLQDLDAVTVSIIYGTGTQRNMKIFLQKDASVDRVLVQSEQFSQEIELGETASFDLTLELFSGTTNTFSLEVVNLPAQIGRYFRAGGGQARLSRVKFTESTRTKQAALEVTLPDRPSAEVAMDQPIPFYVLILPREQIAQLPDLPSKSWTLAEIEALNVGFARLELLPRGKGKLLVRAPQLYHAIKPDETAHMVIEVENEGSRRLDNIAIKVDLPLNWAKDINPPVISELAIGQDHRIELAFTPPADIAVGKYELRIKSTAMSDNQPIIGEDKTVTIEIQTSTNVIGTMLLVLAMIGLVGGMVIFGVRLSRR